MKHVELPKETFSQCLGCGAGTHLQPYRFYLGRKPLVLGHLKMGAAYGMSQHYGSTQRADFRPEKELFVPLCAFCAFRAFARDFFSAIGLNLGVLGCLAFVMFCAVPYFFPFISVFIGVDISSQDWIVLFSRSTETLERVIREIFAFMLSALSGEHEPGGRLLALISFTMAGISILAFLGWLAYDVIKWLPTPANLRAAGQRKIHALLIAHYAGQGYSVQDQSYNWLEEQE